MNKKMKILLSAFVLLASAAYVHARGEAGIPDGNNGVSLTGAVRLSTGTNGLTETRLIKTTNDGNLRTYTNGVTRSSWTNVASDTRVVPMDGVDTSTLSANRNVFEVCSSSEPCFLKNVIVSNAQPNTTTAYRIRAWDSRGSTDPAIVTPLLDWNGVSTGTVVNFDRWLSTGLTVMTSGSGMASWNWSVTKQQ